MVETHHQDAAEQKKIEIKGALSDLPHILGHAQQNGFPGTALTVMKIRYQNDYL